MGSSGDSSFLFILYCAFPVCVCLLLLQSTSCCDVCSLYGSKEVGSNCKWLATFKHNDKQLCIKTSYLIGWWCPTGVQTLLGSVPCAEIQHRASVMFPFHTALWNMGICGLFHVIQTPIMRSAWRKCVSSMSWCRANVRKKCRSARWVSQLWVW